MVTVQIKVPNWLDRLLAWPVMVWRKWKYGYTYRRIYLGEGEWTIVESPDYYLLRDYNWYLYGKNRKFYVVRTTKVGNERTKTVAMHREIMNAPKGKLVDHRNSAPQDNRRENLRFATPAENVRNRRKTSSKTSSKYIGVYRDKPRKRWVAHLKHKNKMIWLGRFDEETDAAKAYDAAAKKYFGEFARPNFPEEAPVS
jgi:hypothetical protein